MTIPTSTYLRDLISVHNDTIVLSPDALTPVRIERGAFTGSWGLEYWHNPQWSAPEVTVNLIRGEANNVSVVYHGNNCALQRLTLAPDGQSFAEIPSFFDVLSKRPLKLRFNLVGK